MSKSSDINQDAIPNLNQAKKDARILRKSLAVGDPTAVTRFDAVFLGRKDALFARHADCLHVIAREAGAESWPRLKLAAETAEMDRAERVSALERALFNGNQTMIDRLLSLDPNLAHAHLGILLAMRDEETVQQMLTDRPELACREINGRLPMHYLCFSKWNGDKDAECQIRLLDLLISKGADVNLGLPAEPGSEHHLSPLYGALGHAGNLALAQALLEKRADPNDNESLYHATELPDLQGVRLLFSHGAEIGRTNALYRMLDFENTEGLAIFLENGADPNLPLYDHPGAEALDDRNALHHAIIRGRSGLIGGILLDAGADPHQKHYGRSAYGLAMSCGNKPMAEMLKERGFATALTPEEQFLAAIAAMDRPEAERLATQNSGLIDQLSKGDLDRPTELAMNSSNLPILKLMHELGFDPNRPGESGMPPIHAAAWWGHADLVRMYLDLGVELEQQNMFGGRALGTAIHGSVNCPGRDQGNYEDVVSQLLKAGAVFRPDEGHLEMGSAAVTQLLEAFSDESD